MSKAWRRIVETIRPLVLRPDELLAADPRSDAAGESQL